jgi:HD-GYP domain-containing protein (c-di-GMP phosphodiesterase class II)
MREEDSADGVWVDAIGVPEGGDGGPITIRLIGAGEATQRRLDGHDGITVVEPGEAADGAEDAPEHAAESDDSRAPDATPDVVFVSTRLPRNEAVSHVTALRQQHPVVALVHTGGETLAAELLRAGARGLLAEGNEASVRTFLSAGGQDTGLLEVYDRQVGRSHVLNGGQRSQDAVTGLLNTSAFDARVSEAQLSGDVPRIGFVRVLYLCQGDRRATQGTVDLVRRRLALQFTPIAERYAVELYALGPSDLAFVGDALSPNRAEGLGADLARAAGVFAPWGHSLVVAVGHAGSEVSQDPFTIKQLAERAVEVAALEQRSTVVGAETLALGASSTTELEAALRLVEVIERHDPLGAGRAAEAAELAAAIAWELGYEGRIGSAIRLATHFAEVGKVTLPPHAMHSAEGLDDDLTAALRDHPLRGADVIRPLAGPEVAAAVRAQHERWDGSGFPDGLAGDGIPVAARIAAIATAFVRRSAQDGPGEALAAVLDGAGSAYDPAIVEAATPLLTARLQAAASARSSESAVNGLRDEEPGAGGHRAARASPGWTRRSRTRT